MLPCIAACLHAWTSTEHVICIQDKRPSYDEWSAELKRVKREQEMKAMQAAIEDEEIASGYWYEG